MHKVPHPLGRRLTGPAFALHDGPAMPSMEIALSALIDPLLARADTVRQRCVLVISGDAVWCRETAAQAVPLSKLPRVTWVSDTAQVGEVLSAAAAKSLLGQERDIIVFDAHAGFDADVFGAVSGTIVGGGLLLLLCPPLAQWGHFSDPAAERIAIWPYGYADISGQFLWRLAGIVAAAANADAQSVVVIEQGKALPAVSASYAQKKLNDVVDDIFCSEDQRAAVVAIKQVAHGQPRRPAVLVADRGRGKTAALGIAAAQLLHAQPLSIVVTAPRPAAVRALFERAQKLLPEAQCRKNHLQWNGGVIQFVAPDVLCLPDVSADLLLVDEAAAIPAALLQQFLNRFQRIVFSTTTHGYEGTGRGFAVRFKQTLNTQTPGWRALTLHTPIRWAQNDPLERLVFDALLLDAASADDDAVAPACVHNVVVERIGRGALLNDQKLLSQLFGLLVEAHYRTRPNDLRNLLDGPGLSVYVTRYEGQVVATALVASEGGFDAEMTQAIYAGRRRPQGHLIPQSLTTHAGLKDAAGLSCARVMRIAVHPALQGKGLGRLLLRHIKEAAQQQGADLFGASFGGTRALLNFWAQENVQPVRLGFKRGHASGEYSLMVLCALSASGESVFAAARARFVCDLPYWLADPLRELDNHLKVALSQNIVAEEETVNTKHDQQMLRSFARGERSYEDTLAPLNRRLTEYDMASSSAGEYDLLFAKVMQKKSWAEVADEFALTGKAAALESLRKTVAGL